MSRNLSPHHLFNLKPTGLPVRTTPFEIDELIQEISTYLSIKDLLLFRRISCLFNKAMETMIKNAIELTQIPRNPLLALSNEEERQHSIRIYFEEALIRLRTITSEYDARVKNAPSFPTYLYRNFNDLFIPLFLPVISLVIILPFFILGVVQLAKDSTNVRNLYNVGVLLLTLALPVFIARNCRKTYLAYRDEFGRNHNLVVQRRKEMVGRRQSIEWLTRVIEQPAVGENSGTACVVKINSEAPSQEPEFEASETEALLRQRI